MNENKQLQRFYRLGLLGGICIGLNLQENGALGLSITTLSMTTLSITTLSITTLSITTLNIMGFFTTLRIGDT
jgi:hypothetical protein